MNRNPIIDLYKNISLQIVKGKEKKVYLVIYDIITKKSVK